MEERSLGSEATQQVRKEWRLGKLTTPESIQKLQTALHAKAKEEPGYRFYLLYDKIYREDVLEYAYRSGRASQGAAGVEKWLGELAQRLKKKDDRPEAVKRVWISKPNGKLRPLGIPTIGNRHVEPTATAPHLDSTPVFARFSRFSCFFKQKLHSHRFPASIGFFR
jgi:hypothetical protein